MHDNQRRVREGEVLVGKYRVERVLGEGGMGVVVGARHLQLDTRVAIKLLQPAMLNVQEAVARFEREARAAARITSEHVARVHDVGALENGAPYMVMEFLEGLDLASVLQQQGAMSVEQAVEFLLQACEAIAEAHALGIVHRDLKPANLFCVRRADGSPSIKVLDFGISKLLQAPVSGGTTKTTALLGTPHYMSPEQMTSSRSVDSRVDLWALGVIFYQLLANDVPFDGDTLPAVCVKIATEPPPPIRSRRPEVPAGVESVIARCLQKDPNQRFQNVAEFARALAPFAPVRAQTSIERIERIVGGVRSAADVDGISSGSAVLPDSATVAPLGRTTPEPSVSSRSPRRALALALGAGAVAALSVWGVRVWNTRPVLPVAAGAATLSLSMLPVGVAPPLQAAPSLAPQATVSAAEPPHVDAAPVPIVRPETLPPEPRPQPAVAKPARAKRPSRASGVPVAPVAAAGVSTSAARAESSAAPAPPLRPSNSSSAFDERE